MLRTFLAPNYFLKLESVSEGSDREPREFLDQTDMTNLIPNDQDLTSAATNLIEDIFNIFLKYWFALVKLTWQSVMGDTNSSTAGCLTESILSPQWYCMSVMGSTKSRTQSVFESILISQAGRELTGVISLYWSYLRLVWTLSEVIWSENPPPEGWNSSVLILAARPSGLWKTCFLVFPESTPPWP